MQAEPLRSLCLFYQHFSSALCLDCWLKFSFVLQYDVYTDWNLPVMTIQLLRMSKLLFKFSCKCALLPQVKVCNKEGRQTGDQGAYCKSVLQQTRQLRPTFALRGTRVTLGSLIISKKNKWINIKSKENFTQSKLIPKEVTLTCCFLNHISRYVRLVLRSGSMCAYLMWQSGRRCTDTVQAAGAATVAANSGTP